MVECAANPLWAVLSNAVAIPASILRGLGYDSRSGVQLRGDSASFLLRPYRQMMGKYN
jgi:hypothetical protein